MGFVPLFGVFLARFAPLRVRMHVRTVNNMHTHAHKKGQNSDGKIWRKTPVFAGKIVLFLGTFWFFRQATRPAGHPNFPPPVKWVCYHFLGYFWPDLRHFGCACMCVLLTICTRMRIKKGRILNSRSQWNLRFAPLRVRMHVHTVNNMHTHAHKKGQNFEFQKSVKSQICATSGAHACAYC